MGTPCAPPSARAFEWQTDAFIQRAAAARIALVCVNAAVWLQVGCLDSEFRRTFYASWPFPTFKDMKELQSCKWIIIITD